MTKIRISSFPEEVQIELEIQAEAAGMSVEEYAADLLREALDDLAKDVSDAQKPVVH